MRTLIDIPDSDLGLLNKLSRERRVSRSELVRSAVSHYLQSQTPAVIDSAFGPWRNGAEGQEDGLSYQDRMRSEW